MEKGIKQALNQAARTNLILILAIIRSFRKKQSIDYVIPTPEQLDNLLQELSNHEAYYPILICAVLGCRRGEALGLQWRDIDFEQNTISIRWAYIYHSMTHRKIGELKTKNSRRTLSLPEALKAELLKRKNRMK